MTVKEKLREIFASYPDEWFNGNNLAQKLDVSRNAVWKAVQELKDENVNIQSNGKLGYSSPVDSDVFSSILMQKNLRTKELGKKIIFYPVIESTNTTAKQLAEEGASHGTVIIADCQKGGRGRLGKTFHSPAGTGIYMSVILRPDFSTELSNLLTACTAVSTEKSLCQFCKKNIKIKWVNDLFISNKKVCGILTEASISCESRSINYAIIGIGVNVRNTKENFPDELQSIVTSLEEEGSEKINRCVLAAEILNNLEIELSHISDRKFLDEYREHSNLIGNKVTIVDGMGNEIKGTAVGIDNNASLLVKMNDGQVKTISSGTVQAEPA